MRMSRVLSDCFRVRESHQSTSVGGPINLHRDFRVGDDDVSKVVIQSVNS